MNSKSIKWLLFAVACMPISAHAVDTFNNFSFDGYLLDSGTAMSSPQNITFKIYSPADCLLYEETVSGVTISSPSGFFSTKVGSGTRSGNDPALAWSAIFSNSASLSGDGCTFNPTAIDGRRLRVVAGGQTFGPFNMSSVPMAGVAASLDGYTAPDFLQVNGADNVTQSNVQSVFTGSRYTNLLDLVQGNSSLYMKSAPTASVNMNNQVVGNVAAPVAATDAANKNYADSFIGGKTADGAVIGALAGGDAGKVMAWDGTKWTAVNASGDATKLPLDGTGTMTGNLNMGNNNVLNAGHILQIAQARMKVGGFTNAQESGMGLVGGDAGTVWYNSSTNQLKYWDGSSALALSSGSGVTSLNGQTTGTQTFMEGTTGTDFNISSGGGVHTFNLPDANVSNRGLLTSADWAAFNAKLGGATAFGGDVSGVYNAISVIKVQGRDVAATAPSTGEILKWNGSAWAPAADDNAPGANSVNSSNIVDGSIIAADLAASSIIDSKVSDVGVDKITSGAGRYFTYAPNGASCANGEFLQWTASNRWECANAGSGNFMADGSVPMTGALRAVNGTVGGPAYSFSSDTNSGLYSPAADNLSLVTGGLDRLVVDASGNVGVGTASPLVGLDLVGTLKIGDGGEACSPGISGALRWNGSAVQYCDGSSWGPLGTPGVGSIGTAEIANATIQDVDVNNVGVDKLISGIGKYFTYQPNGTACANGEILAWNGGATRWDCAPNAGGTVFSVSAGTGLLGGPITTSGSLSVDVGTAANQIPQLNPSAQLALGTGNAAAPTYSFGADPDTGFYNYAANALGWSVGGLNKMVLDNSGRLGLGSSAPVATLDILAPNASARISNIGAAGQFQTLTVENHGTSGGGAGMFVVNTRGTASVPSATQVGDVLGQIGGSGFGSSMYQYPAYVSFKAAQTFTDAAAGTNMEFWTTPSGSATPSMRMMIDSSGKVGIGSTAPADLLSLSGNFNGAQGIGISNLSTGTSALANVVFANNTGPIGGLSVNSASNTALAGGNSMNIGTFGSNPLSLFSNNIERVRIDPTGNVGIGIGSPAAKLEVNGSMRVNGPTHFQPATATYTTVAGCTGSNPCIQHANDGTVMTVSANPTVTASLSCISTGNMNGQLLILMIDNTSGSFPLNLQNNYGTCSGGYSKIWFNSSPTSLAPSGKGTYQFIWDNPNTAWRLLSAM